jgi:hypothetical protein
MSRTSRSSADLGRAGSCIAPQSPAYSPPAYGCARYEALHHIETARAEGAASALLLLIATRLDLRRDLGLHAAARGVVRGVRDGALGAVDQFRQAEQLPTKAQPSARKLAPAERKRERKRRRRRRRRRRSDVGRESCVRPSMPETSLFSICSAKKKFRNLDAAKSPVDQENPVSVSEDIRDELGQHVVRGRAGRWQQGQGVGAAVTVCPVCCMRALVAGISR